MRREHPRRGPVGGLELEERVGVDDGWEHDTREQPADESPLLVAASEARPDRQRRRALRQLVDPVDWRLHRLEQPRLDDRQRGRRGGDGHVPRVRAERRFRRKADCARHAGRTADDEHRARRVLGVLLMLARYEVEDLCPDQAMLGLARVEPDCSDLDVAGVEPPRRDGEPDLRAVHGHGHVGTHGGTFDLTGRCVDS